MKIKSKFLSGALFVLAAMIVSLSINFGILPKSVQIVKAVSPSVQVVSPDGGDNLEIGETKRVFWSSTGVNYVRIYVYDESISGSGSTNYIYNYTIPASIGYFDWTIQKSQLPGSGLVFPRNYKIRIDGVNETTLGATVIASDYSNNTFSISDPLTYSVQVVSPNGGETWQVGQQYTISWNEYGFNREAAVSLYKGNFLIKNIIGDSTSVNSTSTVAYWSKKWTPDIALENGGDYNIRITDSIASAYDASDSYFSITNPAASYIHVLAPNGGEHLEAGKEYTIRWSSGITGVKVISFYKGGNYIKNIHATGDSVVWTVDPYIVSGNDYSIRISDLSSTFYDDSDSYFSIAASSQYIPEGAIIQVYGSIDVYIVKYVGSKKFKRLVLSPSVFRSYGHLKWENLIKVTQGTLDGFMTSDLVRSASNGRMYVLYPSGDTGTRRYIPSMTVFSRNGYDLDSVYEINGTDENSYIQSANIN